ncbi:MAG: haloacid dehalogenase type II [Planctomycetota bacterium]|nr:haloacid dehalogenase type II [Planctomycetota bacterium]
MTRPDLGAIRAITFDCYGTLVDWEAGILRALKPLLAVRGAPLPDEDVLASYAAYEAAEESGEYTPYREVLRGVTARFAERCGFALEEKELEHLPASLARWPLFTDTRAALASLAARVPLVVCSNVDDDLFDATREALGVEFAYVVTASYCRSYKPDPRHFRVALALLGLPPASVLHVAQSRYHDIAPARALGMPTIRVNRPSRRGGVGVAPAHPPASEPDLEVPDLASVARLFDRL